MLRIRTSIVLAFSFAISCEFADRTEAREPIPDRLVVLTFDDSVKSHYTVARPLLKRYGFGATFFITEGFTFRTNKKDYMTWDEIRGLHEDGFEIGNHTRDHMGVSDENVPRLEAQLSAIEAQCAKHGIPKPVTFAWPGNAISDRAFAVLRKRGIRFARRGGAPEYPYERGRGFAYEPGRDHPLLVPSAGDARPDWSMSDFVRAVEQAKDGRIAVLQFHGVPEGEHPWVHTPRERFEDYMRYLRENDYTVIALRDLERYVDPDDPPEDPWAIVRERRDRLAAARLPRGAGFAASYARDREIAKHPAVIFADDFEDGAFRERWDEARDRGTLAVVPAGANSVVGERSLRVTATLGKNTGGGVTKWFESAPKVFIRFYVKFDPTCDYVHHFVTLRANRGLKGGDRWSGFGGAGVKPRGDERFSTALEPWGNWGRYPPPGRWNFYSYWHEMKESRDGKFWGNSFRPERGGAIERGRWICAEFLLVHNTPGERDGAQAYWIDGELRGYWGGINWRKSDGLHANALTLEAYVTDRWTKQKTNVVYFDNVVIAREYIGPIGANPNAAK